MPKEIINSKYAGAITPGSDPLETTFVQVGWTKDMEHVELGTVCPGVTEGIHDPQAGWFVQLDRGGVNRLIRSLRKARDQAFGTDA